jgi:hypothetical protein
LSKGLIALLAFGVRPSGHGRQHVTNYLFWSPWLVILPRLIGLADEARDLLQTLFISNASARADVAPHGPTASGLRLVVRVAQWNIESGLNSRSSGGRSPIPMDS